MTFSNQLLYLNDLGVDNVEFTQVELRYIRMRRLLSVIYIIVFAVFGAIAAWLSSVWFEPMQGEVTFISACLVSLSLLLAIYRFFADPKKQYALREHDLSYQYGLFYRTTITQPIVRIQHVEVKQGPIERRLALASILAFSAGGQMHTFYIPGINVDDAHRMRSYILNHEVDVKDAS